MLIRNEGNLSTYTVQVSKEMDKKDETMIVSQEGFLTKIYTIRGQKVILDFEFAEIYGYETKTFNQQVKNNIEKFDDDFKFQLTKEEWEFLRSKFCTSSHPFLLR